MSNTRIGVTSDGYAGTATISRCKKYRYVLTRVWDKTKPAIVFCLLNPSTADHNQDDPTIRRCIQYAKSWGFGGLVILNLYAFRSTDPKGLRYLGFDGVGPYQYYYWHYVLDRCGEPYVLCAWGSQHDYEWQAMRFMKMLILKGIRAKCLRMTKNGYPAHPLYLPGNLKPIKYNYGKGFSDD